MYAILTELELNGMSISELKTKRDEIQNIACNIDPYLQTLLSDVIHKNLSLLESKIEFNEF